MKFHKIDLRKASGHECPGVNVGKSWYLAKIKFGDSPVEYLIGKFSREWFGLHFDCEWGGCGLQFDAPGENGSPFKELYRIEG